MSDDPPSDRLRERAEESRAKLWFLLEADRRLVTGSILAVLFAGLLAVGVLYPGASETLRAGDPVETLFQAFVTATITGVTLVLTLNQLVLSQELGAVGDQRERMADALAFRDDAADAVGTPASPARPAQFLRALVQVSGERAETLREQVGTDGDLGAAVDDLAGSLVENAERVGESLDGARFGEFEVVSAALDFNYSWKVFAAKRIREEHADELDEAARETLDDLVEVLTLFGPAREHFKTLYFQWELIDLSRAIMAAAIPALVVSVAMLVFVDATVIRGSVAGVGLPVLVVCAATTVAALPFVILVAYVLRIATVAKHTLSIGPFILRETEQVEEVEWN